MNSPRWSLEMNSLDMKVLDLRKVTVRSSLAFVLNIPCNLFLSVWSFLSLIADFSLIMLKVSSESQGWQLFCSPITLLADYMMTERATAHWSSTSSRRSRRLLNLFAMQKCVTLCHLILVTDSASHPILPNMLTEWDLISDILYCNHKFCSNNF